MRFVLYFLVSLAVLRGCNSLEPSQIPSRVITEQVLQDDLIQIQPGQILTVTFEPSLYDIYSIKLERIFQDGNIEGRVVTDFTRFEEEDIYDLGGCVSVQTQASINKLSEGYLSLNDINSEITGIIPLEKDNRVLILTSNMTVYNFNLPQTQQKNVTTAIITEVFNFYNIIKSLNNTREKIKMFGFSNNSQGYVVTNFGAWKLDLSNSHSQQLIDQKQFANRKTIFDVFSQSGEVWVASGEEGVDYYYIDENNTLNFVGNINKISLTGTQMNQNFLIERVRSLKQGENRLIVLMEQDEGLHILRIENDKPFKIVYQYFIPIRHITSFDAVEYTIVATLSSKTYQSGLEIFFDKEKYYVNYFENDEFSIDDVVLDRNTRMGLWIGEDISKSFRHSIFQKNLLLKKTQYEDFIDMSDENNVYFLNHGNQKLMFSAGRRKLELFNTTEILSKVVCSTKQKNFKGEYLVTFMSPFCNGETNIRKISADSLLQGCQVTMRLVFSTSDALFDSSNIGFILGGIAAFILLFIIVIFNIRRKYKGGVIKLSQMKKRYQELENENEGQGEQQQQQQQDIQKQPFEMGNS